MTQLSAAVEAVTQSSVNPSVTVIINNFNYGRFLGHAIESALQQTYERVKVIVVDDGSTDNSVAIARTYSSPNYLVLQKSNGGQSSAIRHALGYVDTDYVINLDSDDRLMPNTCARVMEVATSSRPNCIMYRLRKVNEAGEEIGELPDLPFVRDRQREFVLRHGYVPSAPTSGNAFQTEFLKSAFAYVDETCVFSDGFLVWAAASTESAICIDEVLGEYLVHGANISTAAGKDVQRLIKNTGYALAHTRNLHRFLGRGDEFPSHLRLVDAYTWRSILLLKIRCGEFRDYSYLDCVRYGVPKFMIATHHGWWRRVKNTIFLTIAGLAGSAFGCVTRRPRA